MCNRVFEWRVTLAFDNDFVDGRRIFDKCCSEDKDSRKPRRDVEGAAANDSCETCDTGLDRLLATQHKTITKASQCIVKKKAVDGIEM